MEAIRKWHADQIYLLKGAAVANSPFFENEGDCKSFMELADRYLKDYLTINWYQNNRDGWAMIVTTRSEEEIVAAYESRRLRSKKCKAECAHKEIWRMLSDQVRIWISTHVKKSNSRTGRKGGKVRCNFKRYIFESVEEALQEREKMEKEWYDQAQPRKRYRPSKDKHKLRRKLLRTSAYVGCAAMAIPGRMMEMGLECFDSSFFLDNVLRHLICSTLFHHFPT